MGEMEMGMMAGIWLFALAIYAMFRHILKKGQKLEQIGKENGTTGAKEGLKAEF